jgi:hypothetical protein
MAKALLGHLGGPDPLVAAELAALRRRVTALEDEVSRLRALNSELTTLSEEPELLLEAELGDREPALT